MVGLKIIDKEEEGWMLEEESKEEKHIEGTESTVKFPSMKNTLANLWHLIRGVVISDLGEKRILFIIFLEIDIMRVINGAPWTFNNHLLVFHRLTKNEDSVAVPLIYTLFLGSDS